MDAVIDEFVKVLLTAAAGIISAQVIAVLVKLFQKFNLHVSAEQQARIEKYVQDAILHTEEYFASALKRGATPVKKKIDMAVERVLDTVPGITATEARDLIVQELPRLNLGASAVSFTRSVVVAATNDTK
jgi:hypothetical protein